MGIINFFARLFYNFGQLMASPGRIIARLRFAITAPFRVVGSAFRQLRMVRISRFLPRIPRPLRSWLENIPGIGDYFKKRHEAADLREELGDIEVPVIDGVPFRPDRRTAEYSQIHLVNTMTGQRYVTHIGTYIGRSEAQLNIGDTQLYFLRVNPKIYDEAPLLLQARSQHRIKVDGNDLRIDDPEDSLTVKVDSLINIGDMEYRIELFAWDVLPEYTRVRASWKTNVGPIHDTNEDAIGIYQHVLGYMFCVADGVGSTAAGEIASEFAVNYMLAAFHENIQYRFDWHEVMELAANRINSTMRQRTAQSGLISNASLSAVVIQNWDAYIIHVGDTRVYHYGKDGLHQVTDVHKKEIEQTGLGRGQTVKRQVLTDSLGQNDHLHVDKLLLRLQPNDRLLLVSDGFDDIAGDELAKIIQRPDIVDVSNDLMQYARINQITDNVSVVVVELLAESSTKDKWRAYPSHRVYAGYDPDLAFNFDPVHDFSTRHPVPVRRIGLWIVLIAVVLGFFFFTQFNTEEPVAVIVSEEPTIRPTRIVEFTVPPPTQTPQRTPTMANLTTETPMPLEPSSTVRPLPTSTITGDDQP